MSSSTADCAPPPPSRDRKSACSSSIAPAGVTNQDFHIGEEAWAAGRGLVLVANKWDLIDDRGPDALSQFEKELRERAHYLRWVPIVTTSALSGKRVQKVIEL